MTYLALARKWRPKQFNEIVGQPHVVKALTHALSQNKVHHAYLFTGTHGIGKTTLARIFAKCLNCETGITATPCEKCAHCQEIDSGRFPDLYEIDAASRTKVEDTRELLDNIPYAPLKGRFKVYLIDEVHMLSGHSFNALLKTLEEPPSHVKFLLATTDPQKLPATVLSRCLQFHLAKMMPEQIETQLAFILESEKIAFEKDALPFISYSANGSMRDALSLLDQCIAYGNGKITASETQKMLGLSDQIEMVALLKAIHANNAEGALTLTKNWAEKGVNFTRCLSELLTQLYQIAVLQSIPQATLQISNPELKNCAREMSREAVQLHYQIALIGQRDLPLAPTAQIGFEMIVLRMMAFIPEKTAEHVSEVSAEAGTRSAHNKPTATPLKTSAPTTPQNSSTDWNTVLQQLKLTGPTLALANHCGMRELTNDALHLTLQPKYSALLNARQQQRIQDAITLHMNRPVKVTISIADNKTETPADLAVRTQEAHKQSAKKAISADQTLQRIVKTFDATVIEDSIEPFN
ncbi:MAG: DNA polymerase III, subunit gamma and tau [Gammaproteobacteria bacterium RIFCSPHIGHO2_12_FULL_40_19]|nr:MAG: DNA polymerase III, subunit gamma and tau [Gammaproteobacteria bacterium RIFCSPHIGHO2_12_FULL_40_19]